MPPSDLAERLIKTAYLAEGRDLRSDSDGLPEELGTDQMLLLLVHLKVCQLVLEEHPSLVHCVLGSWGLWTPTRNPPVTAVQVILRRSTSCATPRNGQRREVLGPGPALLAISRRRKEEQSIRQHLERHVLSYREH